LKNAPEAKQDDIYWMKLQEKHLAVLLEFFFV
jgi:hypothetical protein